MPAAEHMHFSGEPTREFWFALRKASTVLEREAGRLLENGLGLSLAQFMLLSAVDAHPGSIRHRELAQWLGLTPATISRLIESGVAAGWIDVSQDPHSRRAKRATLTPAGADLVARGDTLLNASPLAAYPNGDAGAVTAATAVLHQFLASLPPR